MSGARDISERRRRRFHGRLAALQHVYPYDGSLEELIEKSPRRAWQVRRRFRKACAAANRVGCGAAEVCRYLIGTTDLIACLPLIERLTTIDMIAAPPEYIDSVIIDFALIVDHRAEIRESRAYEATTGPPPTPEMPTPLNWGSRSGAEPENNRVDVFGETSPIIKIISRKFKHEFSGTRSCARKPEDFCGFRAENNKPGLSADAKPALSRAILGDRLRVLLDEPNDLLFAKKTCDLWRRGPCALVEFFLTFAAENTQRTALENSLARFLEDENKGGNQ